MQAARNAPRQRGTHSSRQRSTLDASRTECAETKQMMLTGGRLSARCKPHGMRRGKEQVGQNAFITRSDASRTECAEAKPASLTGSTSRGNRCKPHGMRRGKANGMYGYEDTVMMQAARNAPRQRKVPGGRRKPTTDASRTECAEAKIEITPVKINPGSMQAARNAPRQSAEWLGTGYKK